MINSKIAQAMKDAEWLGFEFHSVAPGGEYVFARAGEISLRWNPKTAGWTFRVECRSTDAVGAIKAAIASASDRLPLE